MGGVLCLESLAGTLIREINQAVLIFNISHVRLIGWLELFYYIFVGDF
jgi:hypothetical protein